MQKSTFVHSFSTATSQELSSPCLSCTRHDCQSEAATRTSRASYGSGRVAAASPRPGNRPADAACSCAESAVSMTGASTPPGQVRVATRLAAAARTRRPRLKVPTSPVL